MPPSAIQPLDYAPQSIIPGIMEEGLSNGRMAILLFLFGIPLTGCFIGLPMLAGSFWLAILGCRRTRGHSVCAWLVLSGFALLMGLIGYSAITGR